MVYKREHCILCLGNGFVYIGDNMFSEVKMKKILCPHCNGSGMVEYYDDNKKWKGNNE